MILLFVLIIAIISKITLQDHRIIKTKYGDLVGIIQNFDTSYNIKSVEVYRGIPYAIPPIGTLRFMPPVSGAFWTGIKHADTFASVCPQNLPDFTNETNAYKTMPKGRVDSLKRIIPYLRNQSEDCLYLNLYVPAPASEVVKKTKYPVIVFIHDGFDWNSGNGYDGSIMAGYADVIVVTFNFRLGLLGFLNTNTDNLVKSPSNYGLMDQIAVLHWIQENVSAFGGDGNNVTLLGHGTGAACASYLMISPAVTEGTLFQRVILMSGSYLSPWALVRNPRLITRRISQIVNCTYDSNHSELVSCLRDKPLKTLMESILEPSMFASTYGPNVDGIIVEANIEDYQTFGPISKINLSEKQKGRNFRLDLFKRMQSKLSKYDLLLGVVPAEVYFIFSENEIQYGIEFHKRSEILNSFITSNRLYFPEMRSIVENEYTDWERPIQHPITIRDGTLDALSDAQYVAPLTKIADYHASSRRNTYFYVFEYQTKFGDYLQRQGCVHGQELSYVFGIPLSKEYGYFSNNYTKSEMLLSEATLLYWTTFAKTGRPTIPLDREMIHGSKQEKVRFRNLDWVPYDVSHKKYLLLDLKPKLKNYYRAHKLSFWINLLPGFFKRHVDEDEEFINKDARISDINLIKYDDDDDDGLKLEIIAAKSLYNRTAINNNKQSTIMNNNNNNNDGNNNNNNYYQETNYTTLILTVTVGIVLLVINLFIFFAIYFKSKRHHHQSSNNKMVAVDENQSLQYALPVNEPQTISNTFPELSSILENRVLQLKDFHSSDYSFGYPSSRLTRISESPELLNPSNSIQFRDATSSDSKRS